MIASILNGNRLRALFSTDIGTTINITFKPSIWNLNLSEIKLLFDQISFLGSVCENTSDSNFVFEKQ